MSRVNKQKPIAIAEYKSDWTNRGSPIVANHRYLADYTTNSGKIQCKNGKRYLHVKGNLIKGCSLVEVGTGKIVKIGNQSINSSYTVREITRLINDLPDNGIILEYYATHFCHRILKDGNFCLQTKFQNDYERSEVTCKSCGSVSNMVQYLSTNSMDSEGKINQHATNHAPSGTTLGSDTSILLRKPSHLKSYRKIGQIIGHIAEAFRSRMFSVDYIESNARNTLTMYYESIHGITNFVKNDNTKPRFKNGQAAIAAACFFIAKLHIEKKQRCDLPFTMSSIVEYADQENTIQTKVTPVIVTRICKTLESHGVVEKGLTPELVTVSLDWTNENTALLFRRMELFKKCEQKKIIFAKDSQNGIKLIETDHGVLQVETLNNNSPAYMSGLREEDYLMTLQGEEIPPQETTLTFIEAFAKAKQSKGNVFELCVQRERSSRKRKR